MQQIQTAIKYQMMCFSLEWSNQCLENALNNSVSLEITYSVQEISVWLFLQVNIVFITFRKQQEFT